MYRFSTFTDTGKNPFKIDFVDGIFACKLRFLYSQRSKCADLLNSCEIISNFKAEKYTMQAFSAF